MTAKPVRPSADDPRPKKPQGRRPAGEPARRGAAAKKPASAPTAKKGKASAPRAAAAAPRVEKPRKVGKEAKPEKVARPSPRKGAAATPARRTQKPAEAPSADAVAPASPSRPAPRIVERVTIVGSPRARKATPSMSQPSEAPPPRPDAPRPPATASVPPVSIPATPVPPAPLPVPPPPPPAAVAPPPPPRPPAIPALPDDEEGWIAIEADEVPAAPSSGGRREPAHRPDAGRVEAAYDDDEDEDEEDDEEDGDGDENAPDEFQPIEAPARPEPLRTPPPGSTPHDVLEGVRDGRLHVSALNAVSDDAIEALASDAGLEPQPGERRQDLLARLLRHRPEPVPAVTYFAEGLLEILPDGFGFLRKPERAYASSPFDPYVSPQLIRRLKLQTGHWVSGTARAPRPGERYAAVLEIEEVNHDDPARLEKVLPFESLTVTHPDKRFLLETRPEEVAMRVIDLFCPLGRGQRALIVSPPRAGKTILLQKIADSLARNSPEVEIVVLLLDERPEEVTNMRRSVRGEVLASTFDQPAHRHIRLAELALEKVKRMVELGRHVVVLLDSLTRLGRAYNNEMSGDGRLLTGGLDANALTKPKRFFGAARNIEHGGSLTIVASALVDTGSRLDQVIFEEFKGTGNMEIVLSREIANQRIWPAIDVAKSGTRREDLLLHPEEQRRITALRRSIADEEPGEALTEILEQMDKFRTNAEFLMRVPLE